ncbi:hypothetical protein BDR26DRAFT_854437, partial [Obelidium mucronatum]
MSDGRNEDTVCQGICIVAVVISATTALFGIIQGICTIWLVDSAATPRMSDQLSSFTARATVGDSHKPADPFKSCLLVGFSTMVIATAVQSFGVFLYPRVEPPNNIQIGIYILQTFCLSCMEHAYIVFSFSRSAGIVRLKSPGIHKFFTKMVIIMPFSFYAQVIVYTMKVLWEQGDLRHAISISSVALNAINGTFILCFDATLLILFIQFLNSQTTMKDERLYSIARYGSASSLWWFTSAVFYGLTTLDGVSLDMKHFFEACEHLAFTCMWATLLLMKLKLRQLEQSSMETGNL